MVSTRCPKIAFGKRWTATQFSAGVIATAAVVCPTLLLGQIPANEVVSIRVGDACGMCAGRYSMTSTTVEGTVLTQVLIKRGDEDTLRHKPRIVRRHVSRAEWDALRQSIDSTTINAFVGRIGCPGCTDDIVEWAEVTLRDGTRRTSEFDMGRAPPAIRQLIDRVQSLSRTAK
jgi:hypothetical protein